MAQQDHWRSEAEGETRTVEVPFDPKTGDLNPKDLPKALAVPEEEEADAS